MFTCQLAFSGVCSLRHLSARAIVAVATDAACVSNYNVWPCNFLDSMLNNLQMHHIQMQTTPTINNVEHSVQEDDEIKQQIKHNFLYFLRLICIQKIFIAYTHRSMRLIAGLYLVCSLVDPALGHNSKSISTFVFSIVCQRFNPYRLIETSNNNGSSGAKNHTTNELICASHSCRKSINQFKSLPWPMCTLLSDASKFSVTYDAATQEKHRLLGAMIEFMIYCDKIHCDLLSLQFLAVEKH